jgi:hypothetical protein
MTIRKEFTGMLPGAISKFEELLAEVAALNPVIVKGYDVTQGKDSFYYWGVACQITVAPDDMDELQSEAEALGITWLSDNGDMAYTNGLTIEDFKTYRVNGDVELTPEQEV